MEADRQRPRLMIQTVEMDDGCAVERLRPFEVTDEMVEAGARASWAMWTSQPWEESEDFPRGLVLKEARLVLEAALRTGREQA